MKIIAPPAVNEFAFNEPDLAQLLPQDGLLLNHLETNVVQTKKFFLSLPEETLLYKYADNKWSVTEIMAHMIDMERVYSYRMLAFARNDRNDLPGFSASGYNCYSNANNRSAADMMYEFRAVRQATIELLSGLTDEALLCAGTANGAKATVRALAYHIGGHELHHIKIIKERYLPSGKNCF